MIQSTRQLVIAALVIVAALAVPTWTVATEFGMANSEEDLVMVGDAIKQTMNDQYVRSRMITKAKMAYCVCAGNRSRIVYAYAVDKGRSGEMGTGGELQRVRNVLLRAADRCGGCTGSPGTTRWQMYPDGIIDEIR